MAIILQVNFTPGPAQVAQSLDDRLESARNIAKLAGLAWKVWIQEHEGTTRGGIYLFETLADARDWGDRLLRPRLAEGGASDISIRYFEVNEAPSRITHAPLDHHAAVPA